MGFEWVLAGLRELVAWASPAGIGALIALVYTVELLSLGTGGCLFPVHLALIIVSSDICWA